MKEGDWICPVCQVLSFSWRNTCFKCGTFKPSLTEKERSTITNNLNKRSRSAYF